MPDGNDKQIEMTFAKCEDWSICYKVFTRAINQIEMHAIIKGLSQNKKGGVLSDNIIWYYK